MLQVVTGPAGHYRENASRRDLSDQCTRPSDELTYVELLGWMEDIEQMMGYGGEKVGRRFCGTNVEAAIDLHAVRVDDLYGQSPERLNRRSLADRSRTIDAEKMSRRGLLLYTVLHLLSEDLLDRG